MCAFGSSGNSAGDEARLCMITQQVFLTGRLGSTSTIWTLDVIENMALGVAILGLAVAL
ncbi:hypothetical protein DSUL_100183 [Desulfovibrionales bacterium]